MWEIFLWLLPMVDVFKLQDILSYYSSLGVDVPYRHAQYGMIERWAGYFPAEFLLGYILGLEEVVIILLAILGLLGPFELYLMNRGIGPWVTFGRSISK